MSPLPARMILKKEVVLNSVAEFLGCWAVGGKATLSLSTVDGVTSIAFSNSLSGHPEAPLHPPPAPAGPGPRRRRSRHRGPARRERDRQRAACHQAAQAGAPPASTPPSPAAAPAAPSTPENLRRVERSNLNTLTVSPAKEEREEVEASSTPDHKTDMPDTKYVFEWNEENLDWSVDEARRVHNEMGKTGKCHFCEFFCEPNLGVQSWYNIPMLDHLEEIHPEKEEWFA